MFFAEVSDGSTVCDPEEEGVASGDGDGGDEPTQAYELDTSLESMEVDPTVAYGNTHTHTNYVTKVYSR